MRKGLARLGCITPEPHSDSKSQTQRFQTFTRPSAAVASPTPMQTVIPTQPAIQPTPTPTSAVIPPTSASPPATYVAIGLAVVVIVVAAAALVIRKRK